MNYEGTLSGVKDKASIPEAVYLAICVIICIGIYILGTASVIDIFRVLISENRFWNFCLGMYY